MEINLNLIGITLKGFFLLNRNKLFIDIMKEAIARDTKIQSEHKTSLVVDLKGFEHTILFSCGLKGVQTHNLKL